MCPHTHPHRHAHGPAHTRAHSLQCMLAHPSEPSQPAQVSLALHRRSSSSQHPHICLQRQSSEISTKAKGLQCFDVQPPNQQRWEGGESAREECRRWWRQAVLPLLQAVNTISIPCVPRLTAAGGWMRRQPTHLLHSSGPPSQTHPGRILAIVGAPFPSPHPPVFCID